MRSQSGKTITIIILVVILVTSIAGYSYYQARNLIKGPQLVIHNPPDGTTLDNPLVKISGSARNIAYISLNNRQIFVDNEGNFNEELLLAPGYNIWKVEAKDKFGRVVSKRIELVLRKN